MVGSPKMNPKFHALSTHKAIARSLNLRNEIFLKETVKRRRRRRGTEGARRAEYVSLAYSLDSTLLSQFQCAFCFYCLNQTQCVSPYPNSISVFHFEDAGAAEPVFAYYLSQFWD
ncbi:hypothetical protein E2C01_072225 [Portunus trituberculatus]|uniref:Uncharacterized protein n=1 Tax=Portunus trituberculatus TaxID=210409 RepID=A0A5B7I775_PORTR|nr:hypothetical protein [Portunus trituberculatus]